MTETTPRPDGHVNHGGPILDRHDYRDWVEWPSFELIPDGTRVRVEYVKGSGTAADDRVFVHPDDVPTDPDAELVERIAEEFATAFGGDFGTDYRHTLARGVVALVRDHDKGDR